MTTIPNHDTRVALREALEAVWRALDPSVDDINAVLSELEDRGYALAERTRAAVTVGEPVRYLRKDGVVMSVEYYDRLLPAHKPNYAPLYAAPPLASAPDLLPLLEIARDWMFTANEECGHRFADCFKDDFAAIEKAIAAAKAPPALAGKDGGNG